MERLSWYLKRLSVMEPGEIRHRIGEQFRMRRLAAGQQAAGHAKVPPTGDWRRFSFCTATGPVLPALDWDRDALAASAADPADGAWPALGFAWRWQPDDQDVWWRAPDTGRLWPTGFFGNIAYREGNPYGDVRIVWEPARLQQLVALALRAEAASDDRSQQYVDLLAAQFGSWVAKNPPYRGVHYISAMECGLRLIAACHALDLVRVRLRDPEDTWPALVTLVLSHAPLIAQRLSLFSSRGNHTIAEGAALVYAGVLFDEHEDAAGWRSSGLDILEREAARQVLEDGGGIERAFHYHRFVIDLLGLVARLLTHRGETPPRAIAQAFERGRRFLAAVTLADGETLPVGDGDGGYALSRFLRLDGPPAATGDTVTHFPQTGYSVLRSGATLALFDHGPLGMPPSFGHAHADALSFVLYRHGAPALIDPGTFTYTGDRGWRRYFRSTAAHNTVRVNGGDQATQEAAFLWSGARPCRMLNADTAPEGVVRILGQFDGKGYRHLRGVAYRPDAWILVWDRIDGDDVALAELHWHCGAGIRTAGEAGRVVLSSPQERVTLFLEGGDGNPEIVQGDAEAPLGWYAPAYGRKRPSAVVRCTSRATGTVTFSTVVALTGPAPDRATVTETVETWKAWADDATTD